MQDFRPSTIVDSRLQAFVECEPSHLFHKYSDASHKDFCVWPLAHARCCPVKEYLINAGSLEPHKHTYVYMYTRTYIYIYVYVYLYLHL